MSKAKQFLESKAYLTLEQEIIVSKWLDEYAQQTNKEAIDTFQEYTEKAEEIITTYKNGLHDIENYIIDVADKTEDIRMIYQRLKLTLAMIDTMTGVKPDSTPDHTDITQDAINEVVVGGHTT